MDFDISMLQNKLSTEEWDQCLKRISKITNTRPIQKELAAVLNIQQSSVSDARARGFLPDSWILLLILKYGANPKYIFEGSEPKVLPYFEKRPVTLPISQLAVTKFANQKQNLILMKHMASILKVCRELSNDLTINE